MFARAFCGKTQEARLNQHVQNRRLLKDAAALSENLKRKTLGLKTSQDRRPSLDHRMLDEKARKTSIKPPDLGRKGLQILRPTNDIEITSLNIDIQRNCPSKNRRKRPQIRKYPHALQCVKRLPLPFASIGQISGIQEFHMHNDTAFTNPGPREQPRNECV